MFRPLTTLARWLLWALVWSTAAALSGCYVAPDDRTKARVRLVNATRDYASLDLRVDGSLRQGAVAYGGNASYVEVDPDNSDSTISTAGSATALLSFTPTVSKNQAYAVLAFGKAGALRELLLDENQAAPASGKTGLRVVNAAADAGALDVYLTATGDALATAVAAHAGAAYGELSPALDVIGGNWRLRVTGASSKTDLRLDVADLALPAGQSAVLVLTPSAGGTLVDALLMRQEGAIVQADGANARVRAMAGVGSAGAVTASLGGVSLLENANSPVAGNYKFVASGSPALAISVNGNSVGAPATSLASGRDATLLVYGPAATPTAIWLADDNQLPAATGSLRIRLVNGTTGVTGTASLSVDGEAIGSGGVAEGATGSYSEITASTSATLSVTAGAASLFSATNQALVAGGVYTVFVVGTAGSTSGIIKRDR
ncbi:MAG: DUF4397 domain-containing protein [Burkholderiales bacterium]|nr:DUF4397 domain-containing protein [Burkholderiales bacterium]